MLGKRGRPPFRRTTSMTGITVDVGTDVEEGRPSALFVEEFKALEQGPSSERQAAPVPNGFDLQYTAMVSPRYYAGWRASGEGCNTLTADFLRTCGLCSRRLAPGRDIYMYRFEKKKFHCSLFNSFQNFFLKITKNKSTKIREI